MTLRQWSYVFIYIAFYMLIALAWRGYEVLVDGEIKPDLFDSAIALVLSISLTVNIFLVRRLLK